MAKISKKVQELELKDKISHLLEEARMVLPGTQALLGFQLIAFFNQGFEELPSELRLLHLLSLGFVGLASIFLMAPAAYHRIVEKSHASERLNIYGTRMILTALMALSVGLSIDVSIVTFIVTGAEHYYLSGIGVFIFTLFIWFGFPLYKKRSL